MKKIYLILLLLTAVALSAQILQWSEEVPIRQGENIEWYRSSAPVDGNCVVYTWSDTRNGDRDVWAQKMDSNGNEMWNVGGVLVNGEINRQEDPVVIHTGSGEVIIAWIDFRNEDAGDVYVQKLDTNGNLQWDAAGVPLCLADDIQITLNIVHDENGGAFIIWLDNRNDNFEWQKKILLMQLDLAKNYDLPVVFHTVKQYYELDKILKNNFPKVQGFLHAFNASQEIFDE